MESRVRQESRRVRQADLTLERPSAPARTTVGNKRSMDYRTKPVVPSTGTSTAALLSSATAAAGRRARRSVSRPVGLGLAHSRDSLAVVQAVAERTGHPGC